MQVNNYVGIKFKDKGRDTDGVDCWGLARLIYKNEFNIDLPSFTSEYEAANDSSRIQELISQYKEGWEKVDYPSEGCIVLFRVLGSESHVGIIINETQFLHAREGQDSAIEFLDSPSWKKRIIGYFKYSPNKSAILNAVPHPLRTDRYTLPVLPGTSLRQVSNWLEKEYNIAPELKSKITILVNGSVIDESKWDTTTLKESDAIEYRAVPRGNAVRTLAMIAVMIYAPQLAAYAEYAYMGTAGATIAGATAVYATAYAGAVLVGSALVNAIAPIRPPASPVDPGSSTSQLMVTGGANRINPYGAIPVVLGKIRLTPPLGSVNYLTYENERDSYLSMLLVWGYGPLEVYSDTLQIGDTPITNYTDYSIVTLDRKTEPSSTLLNQFNGIYGNDITQVQTSIEMVCDGNPETAGLTGPWYEATTTEAANSITVAIHFPQGLRRIKIQGDGSGNSYAAPTSFRLEYNISGSWVYWKTLTIGADAPKKDAFTWTETISNTQGLPVNTGAIIRVRRETGDNTEDNPDYRYYHTSILQSVTFIRNARPAVDPVGAKIAKSAVKIKATDQLNGNIEGISAVVQTYCKSWNGSAWVDAATNNPADLFRYVLEHPANPRRITDASTQIDLASIQYWAQYCNTRGFTFNSVMADQRSVLDTLRDICAAGRASPALINGKWSVTIDEEKSNVVQHFTPHNSWGFEGSKALPKIPDGLRVTYYDEDQNYQQAEIIVYNVGKDENNSSLFESISLPGVTKKSSVIDHAKWNMAQIKLRPEIYTLNVDIEYLVCNRGDRVKVMHDVPMWGVASGRVKNVISSTEYELDEPIPLHSNDTYTIRFRSKTGESSTRTLVQVPQDGYYSTVQFTTPITTSEADVLDLFLLGELNNDSQDLMVLSIEPSSSKTAKITMVDYGVTSTYNIFTQYNSLTSSVVFESQITLPPALQMNSFGDKTPMITGFVSDESVMDQISKGIFRYNINVAYVNAVSLPSIVDAVEMEYSLLVATDAVNTKFVHSPYQFGSVSIIDVKEGETYKVRARYVGKDGRLGKWSSYSNHTVIGKTNPPSTVTEFSVYGDKTSGQLLLKWHNNPELDVSDYEVRTDTIGWGVNDTGRIFYGSANQCYAKYGMNTFYIKAVDSSGNYSVDYATVTYVSNNVPNVTNMSYTYADTSLTNATVALDWDDVTTSEFNIAYYEVSYDTFVKTVKANSIVLPADWVGQRVYTIKAVDTHGNKSSGYSQAVSKLAPNPVTELKAQVIDNTVMLYWTLPTRTSLPVDHISLRKGDTWETSTPIGDKKGGFTTVTENVGGTYTYWVSVVDTDGIESSPVALTTVVSEPPDFVFHGEFFSDFSATKVSAAYDGVDLVLPINTTETWQGHYTSRSWSTPQDQINAGYPVFIQPSGGTGYYEEVFDFGQLLASSRVLMTYRGTVISGNPTIVPKISLSVDNSTYIDYNGVSDVFGINFRYVKIRITVSEPTSIGVYAISELSVRLDTKLKNDAGSLTANATDASGTIVNFNKEFIDVQSINVSPYGTTPIYAVSDFKDTLATGTYSVTSNVCTVNITNHGMITGQNIKLFATSGTGINDIYTVTSYTANSFTVNMITPNTSGNCSMYPQSFRVYLFNNSGARVTASASWSTKGY